MSEGHEVHVVNVGFGTTLTSASHPEVTLSSEPTEAITLKRVDTVVAISPKESPASQNEDQEFPKFDDMPHSRVFLILLRCGP